VHLDPRQTPQLAAGQDDESYYQDDQPLDPHDDEMYDDAPRARRRSGLVTALALVGCAMLGTVGAYAYRSYAVGTGATGPAPVITADNSTPMKVVPTTQGDTQANRAGPDRFADAGKEQMVSKQEEPVALQGVGTQAAPRVVLPAPVVPQSGPTGANGAEPKRIRTVTIRPDGTDVSGRPVGAPAPTTRPAPAPAPKAAAPAIAPAPTPATRGGPISLEPQADDARITRTAAAPPAARAAPETTANTSSGGFVVQLSSQKTEAEAQASFRSLQAKFPEQLGDRQPIIRRADLGSKGVFYRTMVGPFTSSQEAIQFCNGYKSAGGQCMVPTGN